MGSSVSVYVGPTIKTSSSYMKQSEQQTCSSETCENHFKEVKTDFCPKCGLKTKTIPVFTETEVDLCDILYDLGKSEDFLVKYEYVEQYLPNMGDYGKFIDPDDGESFSLLGANPKQDSIDFANDENIACLLRYCIDKNISIEIDYEVVAFWS